MEFIQQTFHLLLKSWFLFVENWGYLGVFLLMALESSIVPIPSEVVMPPAAYWASQGRLDFWGVVIAGTAGSYFGSLISYLIGRWAGAPLIEKYGKYFLLPSEKINLARHWVVEYGVVGIFVARLLPVVRHLISYPAGIFKMNLLKFSISTTVGAFVWCTILSWFGQVVIGGSPELLSSPEALVAVCKDKFKVFFLGVVLLTLAYGVVVRFKKRMLQSEV